MLSVGIFVFLDLSLLIIRICCFVTLVILTSELQQSYSSRTMPWRPIAVSWCNRVKSDGQKKNRG